MDNKIRRLREIGKFQLNPERKELFYLDKPIDLPLKEIELLCVLTENGGELVTKEELLDKVWKDSFVDESNLTRHIYQLRKMFAAYGESEELIQNVPRRGYRFTGKIVHKVFEQVVCQWTAGLHSFQSNRYSLRFKTTDNNWQPAKTIYFAHYHRIRMCLGNAVRKRHYFQFDFLHK